MHYLGKCKNIILILCLIMIFTSCKTRSTKIVKGIMPSFDDTTYQIETFSYYLDKRMKIILYKRYMTEQDFIALLSNYTEVNKKCSVYGAFDNMKDNIYSFDINSIEWWKPIYFEDSNYTGFYNKGLDQVTSCERSMEYRFSFSHLENYCYLIVEATLQE